MNSSTPQTDTDEPTRSAGKDKRPLVTFALFAYNQEKFIREAVEGAFAQTYSPLEIILSDDCSSDATFDIMQAMARDYHGPHTLILNRNSANQGIGGHVNRIMEIAQGELIVVAAGDDISLPQRVARLTKLWITGERKAYSLHSGMVCIDDSGREIGRWGAPLPKRDIAVAIAARLGGLSGCTHAWARDVFTVFGPILPDTVFEDCVIPLRSMLLGEIAYCPDELVKYRSHHTNISTPKPLSNEQINATLRSLEARVLNVANNYVKDLRFAATYRRTADLSWIANATRAAIRLRTRQADVLAFARLGYWGKTRLVGKYVIVEPRLGVQFAARLLLPKLYLRRKRHQYGIS